MKTKKKKPTECAWIGEFKLGRADRTTLAQYVDEGAISKIEELVAGHMSLYRPHLQERPTSSQIASKLKQIHEQAALLHQLLHDLDGYSSAQLSGAIAKASQSGSLLLDVFKLETELVKLAGISLAASNRTPSTAGAGTRTRGQRTVPDALLVSKIANVLSAFDIDTTTVSPSSAFVIICQAIANSEGFQAGDPRGSIRAYLEGRM